MIENELHSSTKKRRGRRNDDVRMNMPRSRFAIYIVFLIVKGVLCIRGASFTANDFNLSCNLNRL